MKATDAVNRTASVRSPQKTFSSSNAYIEIRIYSEFDMKIPAQELPHTASSGLAQAQTH